MKEAERGELALAFTRSFRQSIEKKRENFEGRKGEEPFPYHLQELRKGEEQGEEAASSPPTLHYRKEREEKGLRKKEREITSTGTNSITFFTSINTLTNRKGEEEKAWFNRLYIIR